MDTLIAGGISVLDFLYFSTIKETKKLNSFSRYSPKKPTARNKTARTPWAILSARVH